VEVVLYVFRLRKDLVAADAADNQCMQCFKVYESAQAKAGNAPLTVKRAVDPVKELPRRSRG